VGRRLRALVLAALDAAESGREPEGLMAESTWAHDAVVKEYFRRRARDFDAHPYFTGARQP
jgi:hypothetical protein